MLETERLVLRRFDPGDWRDLHEYLSDDEVVRYEPYDAMNESQCRKEAEHRAGSSDFFAVVLKSSGKVIGNQYFHRLEPEKFNTWEMGYVFNRAYHGHGYATESAVRILEFGFQTCGAHRIEAQCNQRNVASWKLLERIGMRREGHYIQKVFFERDENGHPLWINSYSYAVLREEWSGVKE